jgi:hypothetical protein
VCSIPLGTLPAGSFLVAVVASTSGLGPLTGGDWVYETSETIGDYHLTVATLYLDEELTGSVTATQGVAGPMVFALQVYDFMDTPMLDRSVPHLELTGVETARITDTAFTRPHEAALAIVLASDTGQVPGNTNVNLLTPAQSLGEDPTAFVETGTGILTDNYSGEDLIPGFTQFVAMALNDGFTGTETLVAPDAEYTFSLNIKVHTLPDTLKLGIRWYDDSDSHLSTSFGSDFTPTASTTARYSVTATAPSDARSALVEVVDVVPNSGAFYFNQAQLEMGDTMTAWVPALPGELRPWDVLHNHVTAGSEPIRLGVYQRLIEDPELLDFRVDFGDGTQAIVAMLSWEGPDNRFAVTDDGAVFARGVVIENEATTPALTIKSPPGVAGENSHAVVFINDDDITMGRVTMFDDGADQVMGFTLSSPDRVVFTMQNDGLTDTVGVFQLEDTDWSLEVERSHLKTRLGVDATEAGVMRFEGDVGWDPMDGVVAVGFAADIQQSETGNEFEFGDPPAGYVRLYARESGGVARLFTKDSSGTEYGPY